jgi:sec-independent protein translocase protein TatA
MLDGKTEDLLIVLVIVLVLFGAKKLPELARAAGTSARELRRGLNGDPEESKKAEPVATTSDKSV